ncbi:endonuclease/exonuclease/phosphatase family protein [Nocardioides campestrisoli]|uniref:endonuclease/exonuclease/phosphatase family protein n=1 Tax=Nocardioides campestrisoli TaxID=2736757 RepID=UPI00163D68C6|nr:endonuclease/exonuclease/phosphatase family protein [Nocardioides campestrisoli]
MRVATFNILHGRSPEDDQVDLDRFVDAVASLDADVLALQEVDRNQPRSAGADLTALAAEAMGAAEHLFVAALHGSPGVWIAADGDLAPDAAAYGVALLSRLPVLSWESVRLAPVPVRVPMRFDGNRRPDLVRDEARVAVVATVDAPGGPITVANTHLTFIEWWQRRQLRTLRSALAGHPGRLMLLGDLNMGEERAQRLTGLRSLVSAKTFPVDEPTEQLDHILGTLDVDAAVLSGGSSRLALSDHRALYVDLA